MKLYNFWRSLAAFRVRIALKLKRLDFDVISTDLLKGEQFETNFIGLNPQGMVPALVLDDGEILTQSMAILEYLDEVYPTPSLLPQDPLARARVRNICMITNATRINTTLLKKLCDSGLDELQVSIDTVDAQINNIFN